MFTPSTSRPPLPPTTQPIPLLHETEKKNIEEHSYSLGEVKTTYVPSSLAQSLAEQTENSSLSVQGRLVERSQFLTNDLVDTSRRIFLDFVKKLYFSNSSPGVAPPSLGDNLVPIDHTSQSLYLENLRQEISLTQGETFCLKEFSREIDVLLDILKSSVTQSVPTQSSDQGAQQNNNADFSKNTLIFLLKKICGYLEMSGFSNTIVLKKKKEALPYNEAVEVDRLLKQCRKVLDCLTTSRYVGDAFVQKNEQSLSLIMQNFSDIQSIFSEKSADTRRALQDAFAALISGPGMTKKHVLALSSYIAHFIACAKEEAARELSSLEDRQCQAACAYGVEKLQSTLVSLAKEELETFDRMYYLVLRPPFIKFSFEKVHTAQAHLDEIQTLLDMAEGEGVDDMRANLKAARKAVAEAIFVAGEEKFREDQRILTGKLYGKTLLLLNRAQGAANTVFFGQLMSSGSEFVCKPHTKVRSEIWVERNMGIPLNFPNYETRNRLLSLLAYALGMPDLIVRGVSVIGLSLHGKKGIINLKDPFVMERAPGQDAYRVFKKVGFLAKNGELQRQTTWLQIIDIIGGHSDRHDGNYKIANNKYCPDRIQVTGIDNDSAFGKNTIKADDTVGFGVFTQKENKRRILKHDPADVYFSFYSNLLDKYKDMTLSFEECKTILWKRCLDEDEERLSQKDTQTPLNGNILDKILVEFETRIGPYLSKEDWADLRVVVTDIYKKYQEIVQRHVANMGVLLPVIISYSQYHAVMALTEDRLRILCFGLEKPEKEALYSRLKDLQKHFEILSRQGAIIPDHLWGTEEVCARLFPRVKSHYGVEGKKSMLSLPTSYLQRDVERH